MSEQKYASWNPWHGCTKYSEGCRYCYVYRQDEAYGSSVSSEECRRTQNFSLPIKKKRDGTLKIAPGSLVMTCFTSDFLLKDADKWRDECWEMIKSRNDCMFYFFTKRIERFSECVPADWGEGTTVWLENVRMKQPQRGSGNTSEVVVTTRNIQ